MDLDDLSAFKKLDAQNYIAEIDHLPDQLWAGWQQGLELSLPAWDGIRQVAIAGMGGSAIAADLLEAYARPVCSVPVVVHRDYDLPAWASGPGTLLITSSHSGNTEETLSSFHQALAKGCRILALTTGGRLASLTQESGMGLWQFSHRGQPRAAVGLSFGLLLAAFTRLGLLPDPSTELDGAIAVMRAQQESLRADVPVVRNMAKRIAGQLMDRWVTVVGAGVLAPVARRWKGQINELAKAGAQFEFLPEADHNTLAGILFPEEIFPRSMVMFLRAPSLHPRNMLRTNLTRKIFMLEGVNTDTYDAQGDTPLANQWSALHFGDYAAYYLAMAYGVDPTPIEAIASLKAEMGPG